MEVKTITYKRIHILGNYNTEHLEMTAELEESENIQETTRRLKLEVETALGLNKPSVEKPKVYDDIAF